MREEREKACGVVCSALGRERSGREGTRDRHLRFGVARCVCDLGEWGQPMLHLAGTFAKRAEELGITEMSISISHEEEMAITVVVMAGGHHEVHHDG